MVKYDGTCRNSSGAIVQFVYGEDGMAGEYIEDQILEHLDYSPQDMAYSYQLLNPNDDMNTKVKKYKKMFRQEVAEQLLNRTEQEMIFHKEFEQICQDQI